MKKKEKNNPALPLLGELEGASSLITMRTELFTTIAEKLAEIGDIRHIDLWNHNVEFIEQEQAWPRPAVFIEFHPIQWRQLKPGNQFHTRARLSLHVVTDWQGPTNPCTLHTPPCTLHTPHSTLHEFHLLDLIHRKLHRLQGQSFSHLNLVESQTNHNHDELVENIETYEYTGCRTLSDE